MILLKFHLNGDNHDKCVKMNISTYRKEKDAREYVLKVMKLRNEKDLGVIID